VAQVRPPFNPFPTLLGSAGAANNPSTSEPAPKPYTGRFKLRRSSDFNKAPAIYWQVNGVLPLGGITVLHGPPKSYKTYIAQAMALSSATGSKWQGRSVRQCNVLYICPEGFFGLIRRQRAWERSNATQPAEVLYLSDAVNFFEESSVKLAVGALKAQHFHPHFIVVDTLQRASVGANENAAQDMGKVFENLMAFVNTFADLATGRPATCLIIHHDTKDGHNFRGSTAIFGAVDGMLAAARINENVVLSCDAFREGEPFEPFPISFHAAVAVETEDGQQSEIAVMSNVSPEDVFNRVNAELIDPIKHDENKVLTTLQSGPQRFSELSKTTSLSNKRLSNALDKLKARNMVTQAEGGDGRGQPYCLVKADTPPGDDVGIGAVGSGVNPRNRTEPTLLHMAGTEPNRPHQSHQPTPPTVIAPSPPDSLPAACVDDTINGDIRTVADPLLTEGFAHHSGRIPLSQALRFRWYCPILPPLALRR